MRSNCFSKRSTLRRPAAIELVAITLAIFMTGCAREPLPTVPEPLSPDLRARVTLSGISAGGYMAVQTHVALADRIGGVAAIAAGPYHCAEGDVRTALSRCIGSNALHLAPFVDYARARAAAGDIAATDRLDDARVWLFHSRADAIVSAPVADALAAFYATFTEPARIEYVTDVAVAHGWPTLTTGGPCSEPGGDYLNACNYDAAGALLRHLYGDLQPRTAEPAPPVAIDISGYLGAGTQMLDKAFAYFPPGCRENTNRCRLHIAFHGCRQGSEFVDDRFAVGAGLNEWAASNDIVVIYPQVGKSLANPQGCWDWWGYTGADYDLRTGKQVGAVARLVSGWARGELQPDR